MFVRQNKQPNINEEASNSTNTDIERPIERGKVFGTPTSIVVLFCKDVSIVNTCVECSHKEKDGNQSTDESAYVPDVQTKGSGERFNRFSEKVVESESNCEQTPSDRH